MRVCVCVRFPPACPLSKPPRQRRDARLADRAKYHHFSASDVRIRGLSLFCNNSESFRNIRDSQPQSRVLALKHRADSLGEPPTSSDRSVADSYSRTSFNRTAMIHVWRCPSRLPRTWGVFSHFCCFFTRDSLTRCEFPRSRTTHISQTDISRSRRHVRVASATARRL